MRKYIILLIASIISLSISAQNQLMTQSQEALQILQERGEIVIKFDIADKAQINEDLTNIISIDNVKPLLNGQGYEVRAYANTQEFQKFLTRNIPYEIIPKAIPKALTMATTVAQMANWDRYPTYSVYEQMMANFANAYPTLCDIDTIMSQTPSGNYRILVARISDNVHTAENEPHFLYTSSIHGDELTGYYLCLRMINYLLTNYGSISQVTNLINGAEIWICPLSNPEGTYYNSSPVGSTVANSRRYNLAGVDMNRNYPDPLAGQNPDGNSWQPETQAFMTFADKHYLNMSANFHGGAEVTNYPWDTWKTSGNPNADAAWWERICTAYVTTARLVNSSYMTDTYADGVTEGGDWYVIAGGRQDYMNFYKHCRELTIELDGTKQTPVSDLNNKWNENYNSMLNLMQESLYGVRGVITDSCSGQPIRAKVWVNSYDQVNDSSQVYSALPIGNYHKYMNTGTYSITYSATGYASKTISNISLANGQATIVNVALAPAAKPDAQFTGTITDNCSGTVQFTNTSTASTNFIWFFGDGTTSTLTNPTHTYTSNGTYTVKLRALNCKGKDSLVRTDYIVINMAATPAVTNGSSCGPGIVTLSATGSGTLNWYDAASGGNLVNTGASYSPALTNTTTYYVENNESGTPTTVGKTFVLSGGAGTSSGEHYLIFNAYAPFTLQSVVVYNTSTSALSKTIALKNSSGTVINGQTTTLTIPSGQSTVTLNFAVPVGTNMRLSCTNGASLYRNSTDVAYNYTAPGILSITGTDAGSSYYYYFYEWLVQTPGCVSSRVPVTAAVLTLPVAGFTSSVTSNTADFTNTSSDATSYSWNFGDGATSSLQNPSHTYAASGTYNVMLIAANSNCSDTIYHNVTVQGTAGCTISGKTRYASKAIPGGYGSNPTYNPTIYDINDVIVVLKSYPAGAEIARDTSDHHGNYQFANIPNGNYLLSYDKYMADTMQWANDANAIDIVQIKYLITSDTVYDPSVCFSSKYKKAADVDNNAAVNAIDVSRIKAKVGSPYQAAKNFPKGNWVALDTLIAVSNANLSINLKTISYGDYNASSSKYRDSTATWNLDKSPAGNIIYKSEDYITVAGSSYFEVPLSISSKMSDFSALGLELNYPSQEYQLIRAIMPERNGKKTVETKINPSLEEIIASNDDLLVTDENGVIRVVYATINNFDVDANDIVLVLGFRPRTGLAPGESDFDLTGTGVIGNQKGIENEDAYLTIPKVFIQNQASEAGFEFEGFPNPIGSRATLSYSLPENGTVRLDVFNTMGQLVTELVNETQESGKHIVVFEPDNLPEGIYNFTLIFTGPDGSKCLIFKMIY